MKHLVFYFDAPSPQVREVFDQLPQRLQGLSFEVSYQPLRPLGEQTHPSMVLAQQLALACAPAGGLPNRWVCSELMHAAAQTDPAGLQQRLAPARDPQGAEVAQALQDATARAVARGIGGGATLEVDGLLFAGLSGLDALAAHLGAAAGPAGAAVPEAAPGEST